MKKITRRLIAPCGMDCNVCIAHLRKKSRCPGCVEAKRTRIKTRVFCKIRTCKKRKNRYCFYCSEFPCDRLKDLDKRYRAKYGMSEIGNLELIRRGGINSFVKKERKRWQSLKGILCVHDKKYY